MAEPFAVINADDFYGAEAYRRVANHLGGLDPGRLACCLVGYRLVNTLSEHGAVNRGICTVEGGKLKGIAEHEDIRREADGSIRGTAPSGERVELPPQALVSMNLWGFTPALFGEVEAALAAFLRASGSTTKAECYLPAVVDGLLRDGRTDCEVLETDATWFGVTYPEDKPRVQAALSNLKFEI